MNTVQLDQVCEVAFDDKSEQAHQLAAFDLELIAGGQATVNTI